MRSLIDPTIAAQAYGQSFQRSWNDEDERQKEARRIALEKERLAASNRREDQNLLFTQLGQIDPGTALTGLPKLREGKLDLATALAGANRAKLDRETAQTTRQREGEQFSAGLKTQVENPQLAAAYNAGAAGKGEEEIIGPGGPMMMPRRATGFAGGMSNVSRLAQQLAQEAEARKAAEAAKEREADFNRTKYSADSAAGAEERKYRVGKKEAIASRGKVLLEKYPEEMRSNPAILDAVQRQVADEVARGIIDFDSTKGGSLSLSDRMTLKDKDLAIVREKLRIMGATQLMLADGKGDTMFADKEDAALWKTLVRDEMSRREMQPTTPIGTSTPTAQPQATLPDDPAALEQIIRSKPGTYIAKAALAKLKSMPQ